MYELSEKKQQLLERLESTQKELQEAQELAATQPGSVSGMYVMISAYALEIGMQIITTYTFQIILCIRSKNIINIISKHLHTPVF